MRAPRCSVVVFVLLLSVVIDPYSSSVAMAEEDQKVQIIRDTTSAEHEPHVEAAAAAADDHAMPSEGGGEGGESIPLDGDASTEATEEEDSIDGTSPTTATTAEDQASSTAQTIATAAAGEAEKDNTAQNGGEVDGATAAAAAEEVESAREQASEAAGADAAAAAATAGDLENNIDEIAAAGQGLEERTEEVLLEKTGNGVGDGDIEASDGEESGSGSTYDSDVDRAWMEFEGRGEGRLKAAEGSLKGALRSYDKLLREHYLKMSFVQATALGVVGDSIAQHLERRWYPGQRFDLTRSAHAGILNMIIDGVFTPRWYNLLDNVNEERTLPVAFGKALAASMVYSPFANGLFLAGARALRYGPKARFNWAEWRRQLMVCTVRDFEMWPPLHVLSFWLLPKHWRPLTSHVVGVALLAVISSTGLTDAGLPLGQRAVPLLMRWARVAADAIVDRVRSKDRRAAAGAPRPLRGSVQ